jgi:hypothetical protein
VQSPRESHQQQDATLEAVPCDVRQEKVRESELTGINELKICPNNFKVVNFNFPPSPVCPQSTSNLTSDLSLVCREDARKDERPPGGNDSGMIPSLRKKKTPGA